MKRTYLYIIALMLIAQSAWALNRVELSPEYFPQTTRSRAISSALIYVGEPDTDPTVVANQKTVSVQQESGTIVSITQPISTSAGGVPEYLGSPVTLLVEGDYSLTVEDKNGNQIYHVPNVPYRAFTGVVYLTTYDDLSAAVTAHNTAVAADATVRWEVSLNKADTSSTTIPRTMAIRPMIGNLMSGTVTCNGPVVGDPNFQWISGSGWKFGSSTVYSLVTVVRPQWWGAIADAFQGTPGDARTYSGTDNLQAFNSTIASLSVHGGTIDLGEGYYLIDGVWDVYVATLASSDNITISGRNRINTGIVQDDDSAAAAIRYNNTGGGGHEVSFRDFNINQSLVDPSETSWHPGIGITVDSSKGKIERVDARGFTTCFYIDNGSYSVLDDFKIRYCQKGVTVDTVAIPVTIRNGVINDCGDAGTPGNGYGMKLIKVGGLVESCEFSSSPSYGLEVEAGRGLSIHNNTFESYTTSRAIRVRGHQTDQDWDDINNYSSGIAITANRFWDALAMRFEDGVIGVTIDGNSMVGNPAVITPSSENNISASATDKLTIRNINYTSNNRWMHDAEPVYHRTAAWTHAFTKDGVTLQTIIPTTGTFERGYQILDRDNPAFRWVNEIAGTFGTLNGSATTGEIEAGTLQVVILSSLTGIYPGVKFTIVGESLVFTVGNVDTDNLKASFSPVATGAVGAGAAVSYSAPTFVLTGRDITIQTGTITADTPDELAFDLAEGGYINAANLVDNIKIMNPTNGTAGQEFCVDLTSGGAARNITYDTWYSAATASFDGGGAGKDIILCFKVISATVIRQVGTPIEL